MLSTLVYSEHARSITVATLPCQMCKMSRKMGSPLSHRQVGSQYSLCGRLKAIRLHLVRYHSTERVTFRLLHYIKASLLKALITQQCKGTLQP